MLPSPIEGHILTGACLWGGGYSSPTPVSVPFRERATRRWGYWVNFFRSVIFLIFRRCQNTCELLKYHAHIWRVSPQFSCGNTDKYEHDSKDLAGTFTRSKILLTEKYSNGDLVTPTPGGSRSSASIRHTFYYKRKSWDRLSHAYLTGTTTVRLRWYQPSMSATKVINRAHKRESYEHRKMFCNRHLYEHTYRQ